MTHNLRGLRCVVSTCRAFGRHASDCEDPECRGCVPRLAVDGAIICDLHLRKLAEDAIEAARLHSELLQVLTGSTGLGEKVSSSKDPNITLNDAAADARIAIRATLVSWCRMVSEERGISLPPDNMRAIGAYLAKHAEWLAAHPAAAEAVAELHDLAHGEARRIAYPGGGRRFPIELPDGMYATCPEKTAQDEQEALEPCPGTLWTILRRDSSLLPSEVVCNHDETHRWPTSRWLKLGAQLLGRSAA
ncbi:MAG TPA: hypothetical protein VIP77_15910 [Jiangellaceae bacterium]